MTTVAIPYTAVPEDIRAAVAEAYALDGLDAAIRVAFAAGLTAAFEGGEIQWGLRVDQPRPGRSERVGEVATRQSLVSCEMEADARPGLTPVYRRTERWQPA